MHRIFAALPVPEVIADRLLPLRTEMHGARWRRRDHYHITLQFFGEVQREIAEEIATSLDTVRAPSLALELDGVGWFGRKEPRLVYARIAQNSALSALARDCRKIAQRLGLQIDTKPFKPHITLAYCKETPLDVVREWSEGFQFLKSQPFLVDRFHLYESFTSKNQQSRYQQQADYYFVS